MHCNDSMAKKFDVKVGIKFENGTVIEAGINIRPYAKEIVKNLHKHFEIIIFKRCTVVVIGILRLRTSPVSSFSIKRAKNE